MDKQIITFTANEQNLVRIGGEYHYSSNKVSYIGAHFDLGTNWDGFDSVRAVWFTDRINGISTVLDGEGNCTVPTEVLKKKDRVFVNLVGSIASNGELTDRLTTYPAVALVVDSKAKVDSTETAPVTPSQFEQFVSIVQDAVANIKDIVSTTLNADYTLTFVYSDGTSYTTPSIRGERGPQGADGADGTDGNGVASAVLNSNYTLTLTFTDGTSYTTPSIRGAQGPKGDPGDVSQAQLDAAVSDLKSEIKAEISEAYTLSLANLCKADGVEILEQTYINGTSVVTNQVDFFSLRYIPCEAGETYLIYCEAEAYHRARFINYYDSNKDYLSQDTFASEVTAPANSAYMSVSFYYVDKINLGKGVYYVKKSDAINNTINFGDNELYGADLQNIRNGINANNTIINSLSKTIKWNLAEDGELTLRKMANSGSQVVGQVMSLSAYNGGYTVKVSVEQGFVYFCCEQYADTYNADGYNGQYCARFACFADKDDKFIEGYSYPYTYIGQNYLVPSNAKYLYVTFQTLNGEDATSENLGWYWITQKEADEHINRIDLADSVLTKKVVEKNTHDIETLQDVQELRKPTFVFIFDDGNSTDFALKTLFDNYGYKCGFALVASDADEVRLKACYLPFQEDGFEVLAHSVNGTAFDTITDLTTAESYMSDALSRLTSWGFNVKGWVTPSTWLLETQMPILKKYYQYGFGHLTGSAEGVVYHTLVGKDIRQLDRWSLESKTVQQTKDAIDDCVANDGFMIFYAHTYPNNDSNFTVSNMATILNYLKAMSDNDTIMVLPPREAINYYYRYRWADLVGLLR